MRVTLHLGALLFCGLEFVLILYYTHNLFVFIALRGAVNNKVRDIVLSCCIAMTFTVQLWHQGLNEASSFQQVLARPGVPNLRLQVEVHHCSLFFSPAVNGTVFLPLVRFGFED